MIDPYLQMRSWLLPIVAVVPLAGCGGEGSTDTTTEPTERATACLSVDPDTTACAPAADVRASDLVGGCGADITSVEGEGSFGSDPTGWDTGDTVYCCYPVQQTESTCTYGRPYMADGAATLAEVVPGDGWSADDAGAVDLPEEARRQLASAWEEAACDEHAAVAAFARLALELMAFGAPSELVDDTLCAAREEVVHARLGFALASRYAGAPRAPGAFPIGAVITRHTDLASFAAATAREGCIGETVTTLVATECLYRTRDGGVRAALSRIVDDEAGHSRLAWRTVRWALDVGGPEVEAAVAEVFAELADRGLPLPERLAEGPHRELLCDHGVPDAALARASIDRALRDVVLPAARAMLGVSGLTARPAPPGARRRP